MASSRRSRKNALPKATLERARQQAGLEPEESAEDSEPVVVSERVSSRRGAARSKITTAAQIERARARGELDQEMVRDLLANPIREVTEEELHQDYAHVLVDLRNMGILAALLISLLVGLTFVL